MKRKSPLSGFRLGRNFLYESINCSESWILSFMKFPEKCSGKYKSRSGQDTVSHQSSSGNSSAQQVIMFSCRWLGLVRKLWLPLTIETIIFLEFILNILTFPLWNMQHVHVLDRIMGEKGRQILEDEWIWYPNARVSLGLSHTSAPSPQSCLWWKAVGNHQTYKSGKFYLYPSERRDNAVKQTLSSRCYKWKQFGRKVFRINTTTFSRAAQWPRKKNQHIQENSHWKFLI